MHELKDDQLLPKCPNTALCKHMRPHPFLLPRLPNAKRRFTFNHLHSDLHSLSFAGAFSGEFVGDLGKRPKGHPPTGAHVHFALQELQDAVGTTVGAGVNLTGQLTRAAVPVAQGIVGAVRGIAKKQSSCF